MALMSELERIARRERKTVLVLDTATGSGAETVLASAAAGKKCGEIPRYALMPGRRHDGHLTCSISFCPDGRYCSLL